MLLVDVGADLSGRKVSEELTGSETLRPGRIR